LCIFLPKRQISGAFRQFNLGAFCYTKPGETKNVTPGVVFVKDDVAQEVIRRQILADLLHYEVFHEN